ncbi:right-handed parallel beta-helix repeat-containing protein [Micromonospora purpureochromogenes]|uniref:right-handed parallel beta-helix repeat-containing protein n=1 Tax=Micromonospora purpureochromogenes TaxID=47872 RepID=UPI0033C761B7
MKGRLLSLLAVVPLGVGGFAVVAPTAVAPAVPAAAVTTDSEIYVSRTHCVAGADGSPELPFCSISQAAAVAQPGQTVLVQPGDYPETVSITRSGTESAPITFRAVNSRAGVVRVGTIGGMPPVAGHILSLTDVHDVVVEGFTLNAAPDRGSVLVDGADRVVLDRLAAAASKGPIELRVTGGSTNVTISRSYFATVVGAAVVIDGGTTDTVVTGNELASGGLLVNDAPRAVITNNTIRTFCVGAIDIAGVSPGASVRNNIVRVGKWTAGCAVAPPAVSVSPASTAQSVSDYNLIAATTAGPLYSWGGTDHSTLASFTQSTGHGTHDIVADPRIPNAPSYQRGGYALDPASPAVDSGDPTAPGVTPTDMFGNPRTDNPAVSNSSGGYLDRGAIELQGPVTGTVDLRRKPGAGPMDVTATADPAFAWPTSGSGGSFSYRFSAERFWRVTSTPTHDHTFRRAGPVGVDVWASFDGFRTAGGYGRLGYQHPGLSTVVGALYTPLPPTRLLDTRAAIGTPTTTPLAPNAEVVLPITGTGQVSSGDLSAVVLNVTVTQPSAAGFVTVYPDQGSLPNTSNVNFVARETVANLVTVPVVNGKVRLRNSGGGTIHLVADLQGVYRPEGSGLKPLSPFRVLDTRTTTAVPPRAEHLLDLSAKLPVDATAAVLNVTVTQPASPGVLTVYPYGSAAPVASNINFVSRQTIPNLVIVPVHNGRIVIRNASAGSTHVVADLAGYFGSAASGATAHYVPYGPARIVDSRTGTGLHGRQPGPLRKQEAASLNLQYYESNPINIDTECNINCPLPTALVGNVTVTGPTAPGVLTAYPYLATRPATSNVNFIAGETASNLALTKANYASLAVHNGSSGSTHVIIDQSGYFITAAP